MSKPQSIDWDFIAAHEGARITRGYIPAAGVSKSGVTIATGVDLGQRNAREIDGWDLPPALRQKLHAYCGLCGDSAAAALEANPLVVSGDEAEAIDSAAAIPLLKALETAYDAAAGSGAFAALPRAARTVLASVAYQYGPNLARRTPRFWRAATAGDWTGVVHELEHFGDAYPTRHRDEARYLKAALDDRTELA